jgi:inorganic pyrophosphatase
MTAAGGATVEVVVEVPRGSRNKLEIDDDGIVRFERRLPASVTFPADYGFVPGTSASDGERLDALVLMPEPTYPGVRDLADLPAHQLAELSQFFDVYRDLDPRHGVRSDGSGGAQAAADLLQRSGAATER